MITCKSKQIWYTLFMMLFR